MGQPSGGQGMSQQVCAATLQHDSGAQQLLPEFTNANAMPAESRMAAAMLNDLFFMI
jgi:hypothetical protein